MDQKLLEPLTRLEVSLSTLVSSLTTTNTFTSAPGAAQDLVHADEDLSSALKTLYTHQNNYAEILRLRARAEELQNNLKLIVQKCVDFRTRLAVIDPRILEDVDDEEGKEYGDGVLEGEVDYLTLLALASRIGKHNAIAAHEAEQEAERQIVENHKRHASNRENAGSQTNGGTQHLASQGVTQDQNTQLEKSQGSSGSKETEAIRNTVSATNNRAEEYRSYHFAPVPPGTVLREGALGKLQLLREQRGDAAVDNEVERLVREHELGDAGMQNLETEPETGAKQESVGQLQSGQTVQMQPQQQQKPRPPAQPRERRKQLDLELPGDSDEDE